jgi:hypothetical protein
VENEQASHADATNAARGRELEHGLATRERVVVALVVSGINLWIRLVDVLPTDLRRG